MLTIVGFFYYSKGLVMGLVEDQEFNPVFQNNKWTKTGKMLIIIGIFSFLFSYFLNK